MAAPTHPTPPPSRLTWKRDGEYQRASDHRCLCFRESTGSMIGASIFCVAIVGSAGWMAVQLLLTGESLAEKACSLLFFLIVAVFIYIPWLTIRGGRRVVIFDRGEPGIPGEIRLNEKSLPAASVKCLSTRSAGGGGRSMPRNMVVAEMQDGTVQTVGLVSVSTWTAHYAQEAANWMGLTFRPSK
ncbi:MAG: hypothetical protein V4662_19485 [Verrucomicrobiota bacterium]